jgi:DNA mismatch repair protein MutL
VEPVIEKTDARIRVLDPHIANKIAAGEVVERPSSVVKELVENALDAHATRVEVFAEAGGSRLLRVVDDGWGVAPDDLGVIFAPHATSKLSDVDDLECIATLGFRGEALASIGSVSQARIVSRMRAQPDGAEVRNEGGRITPPRSAAAAPGTDVTVRNLFFNTPARARFLRTVRTEIGHIEDLITRFALAFPEVGFRLVHDGKELVRTEPGEDRRARVRQLFGKELGDSMLHAEARTGSGRVEAFLSPPSVTRANARGLHFFVNGRFIRDKVLHRVVRDVYRDTLHHGRYPVAFLFLDIDPAEVDVNVHPTKAEVRWRNPRFLHSFVAPVLRRALRDQDHAAELSGPAPEQPSERLDGVRGAIADYLADQGPGSVSSPPPPAYAPGFVAEPSALSVFQVHDSYLVCEVDDGIAIVDQHALHERVQYDRILDKLTEGGVEAQRLLVPEQVELPAADRALLDERGDLIRKCGFEWSPFGDSEVALEAIPAVIPRHQAGDLLRDLVDLLRAQGETVDARTLFHEVADTMACKAAVRFGDRLSREEAAALLEESGALDRAFVCPHGRPTVLRLNFSELEKRFGRR